MTSNLVTELALTSRFPHADQGFGPVSSLVTLRSRISYQDHQLASLSSLVTVRRLRPLFANIRGFSRATPAPDPRAARRGSTRGCRPCAASAAGSIACSQTGMRVRNSISGGGAGADRG